MKGVHDLAATFLIRRNGLTTPVARARLAGVGGSMAFTGLLTGTEQSSAGESGCEDESLDAPWVSRCC